MPFAPWRRRTPIKRFFINFLSLFLIAEAVGGCVDVFLISSSFSVVLITKRARKDKPQKECAPTDGNPKPELSSHRRDVQSKLILIICSRCHTKTSSDLSVESLKQKRNKKFVGWQQWKFNLKWMWFHIVCGCPCFASSNSTSMTFPRSIFPLFLLSKMKINGDFACSPFHSFLLK